MVTETNDDAIAIVGIGCRFPQAEGPDAYWSLLRQGRDAVTKVPSDRAELAHSPIAEASTGAQHGAFLPDVAGFDWRAFSISPREAKYMDPQQRMLLEVAWEAAEDAGIATDGLAGSDTSVFVGIMWNDYAKLQKDRLDGYSVGGGSLAFAANRISYAFDLHGPSMAIDVSCASSLVAVHQACMSLRCGESSLAIAGGVNLMLAPDTTLAIAKAGILSPDGRCKTFDASANGFVRGEGVGLVLLKPLARARADGNRVYATIRATTVLHSGRSEWIMAPSVPVQASMLRTAYRRAGIDPSEVDFVELHGTGTQKGDPIEAEALGEVVGAGRSPDRPCLVGSVKTNIGHLDSAAGIAGLIKTALAIHHRQIPPSLHLDTINPQIKPRALGLSVASALTPWPNRGRLPVAGVTGLSFGGGNAHIVLEGVESNSPAAGPNDVEASADSSPVLLPLSTHHPRALFQLVERYRRLLLEDPGTSLANIAAAAAHRRSHQRCRAAFVASDVTTMLAQLNAFIAGGIPKSPRRRKQSPRPVLVMANNDLEASLRLEASLAESNAFVRALQPCQDAVSRHADWSVARQLTTDDHQAAPARRAATVLATQIALSEIWRAWGIEAQTCVGEGRGQLAAAHRNGTLPLDDAFAAALGETPFNPSVGGRPSVEALAADGHDVFVIVGADARSGALWQERLAPLNAAIVIDCTADRLGLTRMLQGLAAAYRGGATVNWASVCTNPRGFVPLPRYPWQHERMWIG